MVIIGKSAFSGCSNLTSITIPASVTTIGDSAFAGTGLTSVEYKGVKCPSGSNSVFPATVTQVTVPNRYDGTTFCGVNVKCNHPDCTPGNHTWEHGARDDDYFVSFNMKGHGEAIADKRVPKDGNTEAPTAPVAAGYAFGGWYTDEACTNAFDFATSITANITLYAKWTEAEASWYVGETLTGSGTFGQAVAAVNGGSGVTKIQLFKNVDCNGAYFVAGTTVTLELNGKTITRKSGYIDVKNNLTIQDSSSEKTGTIDSIVDEYDACMVVTDNGHLTIQSGNYKNGGTVDAISIESANASCTINGGDFTVGYFQVANYNGTLTINGGSFTPIPLGYSIHVGSKTTIYNATFHSTGLPAIGYSGGELIFVDSVPANTRLKNPGSLAISDPAITLPAGYVIKDENGNEATVLLPDGPANSGKIYSIEKAAYSVTTTNDGNGTGIATPASGAAGTEVTLTATPNNGYKFKEWQVISGGVTVTNNRFTIGTSDVEVKAIFEKDTPETPSDPTTYNINIDGSITDGTVVADKTEAAAGETVTLTVSPEQDFVLSTLFYSYGTTTENVTENSDGTYSFEMPAGDVSIKASFSYPVYVAGIAVTGSNATDVLGDGTVSYALDTKTLTLNGAIISGARVNGSFAKYGIYAVKDLNIVVGASGATIQDCSYGIEAERLTLSGGSLTIKDISICGIAANHTVAIQSGNIDITSAGHGISAKLNGESVIRINGGSVTARGGSVAASTGSYYGLAANTILFGNNCHVIASGGSAAAAAVPSLTDGASGVSKTAPKGEFVPGMVYNGETYLEYKGSGVGINVTGISINTPSPLYVGQSTELIAAITPDNATNKNVTWASSDPSVATVDTSGKVAAVAPGTATITVTTEDGGHRTSCNVHVHGNWTYRLKTGTTDTVEAYCGGCQSASSDTLTISKPTREVYNGPGTTEAALNKYNKSVFTDVGEIQYQEEGSKPISHPLTDVGTYIASVTVGSGDNAVTASVEYTIAPQPVGEFVCMDKATKIYYTTLADGLNAVAEKGTLIILCNLPVKDQAFPVDSPLVEKEVFIDVDGHTLWLASAKQALKSLAADGWTVTDADDEDADTFLITKTQVAVTGEAQIGDTVYPTLAEAIAEANKATISQNIRILKPIAIKPDVSITNEMTIINDRGYSLWNEAYCKASLDELLDDDYQITDLGGLGMFFQVTVKPVEAEPVARNIQTGKEYTTAEAALAEAVSGQTVIMIANSDESTRDLTINPGITLHLDIYELKVNSLYGRKNAKITADTYTNDDNIYGTLVTDSLELPEDGYNWNAAGTRAVMPIWNGEDGYIFANVGITTPSQEEPYIVNTEAKTIRFKFRHAVGGHANTDFLQNGNDDNRLNFKIRAHWKGEKGSDVDIDFTYSNEFVSIVASDNSMWYTFTLTEYDKVGINIEDFSLVPIAVSDTGAVTEGAVYPRTTK